MKSTGESSPGAQDTMAMNILKILAERREKLSKLICTIGFSSIIMSIMQFIDIVITVFFILVGPEVENDSDSSDDEWSN
jgi:hypothetical protein